MDESPSTTARFACDAMLKGLARWLRAHGYDTFWQYGIDDGEIVRLALAERRILLTGDSGMMRRKLVRDAVVAALFIRHDLPVRAQLRLVVHRYQLAARPPRCMACGGELRAVDKASVRDEAPPRTYRWLDEFFRCARCGKLYWRGTHWRRIATSVRAMLAPDAAADANAPT
ncbi:MAG: Mut7-C RNAse domain-containing protein [Planctomycetota bacterium]